MKKLITIVLLALTAFAVQAQLAQTNLNLLAAADGAIVIGDNTSTNLPSGVYRDVPLWSTTDGSLAPIAVMASVIGTNSANTNTFTYTLQAVPDRNNVTTTSGTNDQFTFTLVCTGTTRATTKAILPVTFLTGAEAVRLVTVASSDATSNMGSMTNTVKVVGFRP